MVWTYFNQLYLLHFVCQKLHLQSLSSGEEICDLLQSIHFSCMGVGVAQISSHNSWWFLEDLLCLGCSAFFHRDKCGMPWGRTAYTCAGSTCVVCVPFSGRSWPSVLTLTVSGSCLAGVSILYRGLLLTDSSTKADSWCRVFFGGVFGTSFVAQSHRENDVLLQLLLLLLLLLLLFDCCIL